MDDPGGPEHFAGASTAEPLLTSADCITLLLAGGCFPQWGNDGPLAVPPGVVASVVRHVAPCALVSQRVHRYLGSIPGDALGIDCLLPNGPGRSRLHDVILTSEDHIPIVLLVGN